MKPPKPLAEMTPREINKALDRLSKQSSDITGMLIDAGRGTERISEILCKDDLLSVEYKRVSDQQMAIHAEIERRYGPGAPSRFPPRWPRK